MRLSVIVPTYNERENVPHLVERLERALGRVSHELIFVDDSTDGTDDEIARLAVGHPNIVLVHREIRGGLATAVVEGFRRAESDAVCVLDADLQHPPEVVPSLVEALERTGADLVVASRNVRGGGYEAFSAVRRLASQVATHLARALLRRARLVADPMSGFFVVRREAVRGIALQPVGYKILLEILVRAPLRRVTEVPYTFRARGRGTSKLTLRQQGEYLAHLLRLLAVQPEDLRFLRFCLVGSVGALVNMGVLWGLTTRGIHYFLAGTAGTVIATTSNFLLNDAFTWQDRRSTSAPMRAGRYLRYWVVTGVSSAVQLGLLFALTTAGTPYLISNVIGIGAAAIWNFRMNGAWTWTTPRQPIARVSVD